MARTKQTARKATGGKAPGKGLAEVTRRHKAIRGKSLPGEEASKGIKVPMKRRRYRYKPRTVAFKEMRQYQKGSQLLLWKLPFARLVEEISERVRAGVGWQASAIEALQEACEAMLVTEFQLTNLAAIHAGRVTIQLLDMKFIQQTRLAMTGSKIPGGRAG